MSMLNPVNAQVTITPMEMSVVSGVNGSMLVPSARLRLPNRPYFTPSMKPHMRVDTIAGTA